jgi:hypothetical protein
MILRFMQERTIGNAAKKIFCSEVFLKIFCIAIFAISIFLRSTMDIGADTGVYINLGEKIARGGKYYYDFFESNFPISFYFYALEYQASRLLNVSPIILSEIVINSLALLSIFWSANILQKTSIYQNKAHYNSIIISYFLSFFLRYQALEIGEFGTKTSLLLILLYPYISYSFERKIAFTKKDKAWRGCLMGLMSCIKPHYVVLIFPIEIYRFLQQKSLRFFVELDKLVMLLIGALYLFLMLKFTPEFFEFMVPMWSKYYSAYDNYKTFFDNSLRLFASGTAFFSFIFLVFSRLKFEKNDKILLLFFIGASLLIILENVGTIDQYQILYAVTTICCVKILSDFFTSQKFYFSENKFIFLTLLFLPIFDLEALPVGIFTLAGFVNVWWIIALVYPFFLVKKIKEKTSKSFLTFFALYFLFLLIAFLVLKYKGGWAFVATNLSSLFIILYFFEKKIYSKISSRFSDFSVFLILASASCVLYSIVVPITKVVAHDKNFISPNKFTEIVAYYAKTYAPQKDDGIMMSGSLDAYQFPLLNYLQKENRQKFHIAVVSASYGLSGSKTMFPTDNTDKIFTYSYLMNDITNQLKDSKLKVIFFNNSSQDLQDKTRCFIGSLEYYFLDPVFKKIFLQNFHFENHFIIIKDVRLVKKIRFLTREKPSVFDALQPTTRKVHYDFEVYVRNEKN